MSQDPLQNPMSNPTTGPAPSVVAAAAVAAQTADVKTSTDGTDNTPDGAVTTNADGTTSPDPTTPVKPKFEQPIVALPDKKFFMKRMIIVAVVLGVALWFFRDGFYKYPEQNRKVDEIERKIAAAEAAKDEAALPLLKKEQREIGTRHNSLNMAFQKYGGFPVALLGLYLLVKFLRDKTGELRLEGDVLHAPRHPPIPVTSITGVDNVKWDKKGIAIFSYRLADGTAGKVRVDDFVFDRPPTDAIHDELIAKMPKAQEV